MKSGDGARTRGPTFPQLMLRTRSTLLLLPALLAALALACSQGVGAGADDDASTAALDVAATTQASTFDLARAPEPSETQGFVLTSLVTDATVNERVLEVRGIVDPGSTVTVGQAVATVGPYGHFSVEVELDPGENLRTFAVTADDGSAVLHSMMLNYEPTPTPAPSTIAASATKAETSTKVKDGSTKTGDHTKTYDGTKTKDGDYTGTKSAADQSFTAWQKFGSCSEDPPYDIFKGTAAPGTTITVQSLYGSGTAVAGDDGKWRVTVYFPDAPVGVHFDVVASDGTSSKTLSFVRK